ncbi:MAG: hypothetical protein ACRYFS_16295 [Janthinobacterium lividum]
MQIKKNISKKIEDLAPMTLPFGMSFLQFVGTGATPEQAAIAIEACSGQRIPVCILHEGIRAARQQSEDFGALADTISSFERSGFPIIEMSPTTLLARLIQNRAMHESAETHEAMAA